MYLFESMSLFRTPTTVTHGLRRTTRDTEVERLPDSCSCSCANNQEEVLTALRQLQRQVEGLQQVQAQSRQSTTQTVPKELAAEVRQMVTSLAERVDDCIVWDYSKSFTDRANQPLTAEVVRSLTNENYSSNLVRKACQTYFKSRRRRAHGGERNLLAASNRKQRRRQRKHNKLRSRRSACRLSTSLLPPEKTRLEGVLSPDFVSSEESASESGSEGEGEGAPRRRVFIRHPVTWRSPELTTYFDSLDRKYSRRQSARGKEMMVKRVDGDPSTRSPPANCPEWAVRLD